MASFDFTTLNSPVQLPIITANWFILNTWDVNGSMATTTVSAFGLMCGPDRTMINLIGATDEFKLDAHNGADTATVIAEAPYDGGWITLDTKPIPHGHHTITLSGKALSRITIVGAEIELKSIEAS